jgi:four helix bundle protein
MARSQKKGEDIAERLLALGVAVVQIADRVPKTPHARHIASQMVRAVTSAGANYEEARRSETRADLVHKVAVAAKEVGETIYWLRLTSELQLTQHNVEPARREASELTAILVASVRTARANG